MNIYRNSLQSLVIGMFTLFKYYWKITFKEKVKVTSNLLNKIHVESGAQRVLEQDVQVPFCFTWFR